MERIGKGILLNKIFKNSLDAIIVTDVKGYILDVNKAYEKLSGYKKEEIMNKHTSEFSPMQEGTYECTSGEFIQIDKEFSDNIKSSMRTFMEGQNLRNVMRFQLRKDGKVVPVEDSMVFLFDDKGEKIGAFSVIRDITDRRQVEARLRDSEEQARALLNVPFDVVLVLDKKGTTLDCNKAYAERFNKSIDELKGTCCWKLYPPEVVKRRKKVVERVFQTGKPIREVDEREGRFLDNVTYPIFDKEEKVTKIAVFSRDVTEQKLSETALKVSRDFLENIIQSSLDAIVVTNEQGYVTSANSSFCQLTGYSEEEILEKYMSTFSPLKKGTYNCTTGELVQIDQEFFDNLKSIMTEFAEEHKLRNKVGFYLRKDNVLVPVEYNMSYLFGNSGEKIGAFAVIRDITKRRKKEKEIREGQELLERVIEDSWDGIAITDATGHICSVNKALVESSIFSKEELIGNHSSVFTIDDKDLRKYVLEVKKELYETGHATFQSKQKARRGGSIDVECSTSLIKDKDENYTAGITIIRDISEKKRAEEALKQSEEKYHKLIEHANDAIVSVDTDGTIIGFNKKAEEVFGYSREEVIGKSSYLLISHRKQDFYQKALNQFAKTGTAIINGDNILEGKAIRKGGEEFPVEYSYYTINVTGEYIATGIIRDITKRKETEDKLKISEKKFYNLIEHAHDAIISLNKEGIIIGFNKSAEEMFGYSRDELVGKHSYSILFPRGREKDKKVMEKFREDGIKFSFDREMIEGKGLKKNGKEIDVEYSFYIIESEGEAIITALMRDITKRKKEEKKLFNYQKKLKALTTELLLSEQRERKVFADFLHDEIGQQLFATRLQIEQVKGSLFSSENTTILGNALNNLYQVINQTRTLTTELSSPILKELGLEKALEWLAEQAHKKYDIVVGFDNDNQKKPLDENVKIFLYHAVIELLTNVAKHAQTKNARLSIKRDKSTIRICVEDNGVGFLFPNEHSSDTKPDGFGLFRIKERLEPLGGQLEIESQPNRGSSITLTVPLRTSGENQ
jgi:two-component system sensor histidine kinase UhpB